jgi:Ca-activated chloride channel family protein
MLDLSGSMRFLGKLERAKDAVRYLAESLDGEDQFGLIGFADSQVAWLSDLGRDKRKFLRRLAVQEGYGQTALHDAVAQAPALVNDAVKGRKAIVLFTDGVDNASKLTIRQATDLARQVNVPIYAIGFSSVPAENLPQNQVATQLDVLREVAEQTGGRLFLVDEEADLSWTVSMLDAELRHQYVLGYYPSERVKPGRFQSVRVEVRDNKRLDVRTRSGFVLTP